ncbi:hypothetical protein BDV38DRAFT_244029 [Aspergillus pseudotamarii]|uniref:Uncharacterized protein n=1 Tax=Aspergillus pseudotamarii TaxID=132259 RepID=A0A5N6SW18_ASPPS|nr:uncharacterized protein BDV38DRAFT_244029 [Aspergillus pseudotamarii]KAE8138855.1 hypothetical protein BDV38DRAFT_244029 [Aspergillus pseudotamarii]
MPILSLLFHNVIHNGPLALFMLYFGLWTSLCLSLTNRPKARLRCSWHSKQLRFETH